MRTLLLRHARSLYNTCTILGQSGLLADDARARRFQEFFTDFPNAVQTGQVGSVYAEDAYLNDSLKEVRSAREIEEYFIATLEMANRVEVQFQDIAVAGDNYYFRWTMDVEAPKLNGGEVIRSQGRSHVLFDTSGKVTMHRDYWDASSGLLEHIPVLGAMIRWVKNRLQTLRGPLIAASRRPPTPPSCNSMRFVSMGGSRLKSVIPSTAGKPD